MRPPKQHRKRQILRGAKKCVYCGNPDRFEFTVDHRLPLSRGGDNSMKNLCCCCIRCNLAKEDMTDVEFITYANMLGWPWCQQRGRAYGSARKFARRRRRERLEVEFSLLVQNDHKRKERAARRANLQLSMIGVRT